MPSENPPASLTRSARTLAYLMQAEQVEGWMSLTTALAILEVAGLQEAWGLHGNLAEIGIHHGKSFLVLAGAARPDETAFAIDVFEQQELNVDQSGHGDRQIFQANLRRFFPGAQVSIIARSSTDLRGHENEFGLTNLRFLSIDGGHTRELTMNDLRIADAALAESGACCLDDVFSTHWTGVITGLFEFLNGACNLVPVALFPNKLFLCRPGQREAYARHFRAVFDFALERTELELHTARIDVFGERWPQLSHTFTEITASLAERQKDAECQRMIAAAEARADAAEARVAAVEKQLTELMERTEQTSAWADALRNSTSWRITSPLRTASRLFRNR